MARCLNEVHRDEIQVIGPIGLEINNSLSHNLSVFCLHPRASQFEAMSDVSSDDCDNHGNDEVGEYYYDSEKNEAGTESSTETPDIQPASNGMLQCQVRIGSLFQATLPELDPTPEPGGQSPILVWSQDVLDPERVDLFLQRAAAASEHSKHQWQSSVDERALAAIFKSGGDEDAALAQVRESEEREKALVRNEGGRVWLPAENVKRAMAPLQTLWNNQSR